ncbi:cutinase family protein [Nocardia sp. alder85J]|uniref:cutinase family protein n=1 Tax=Nocardia sp. alder85J TaxID=2862949 RepID=UPI001CD6F7B7|nr:cutinase family protein [Nocardia sp. alder85J]MCX4097693.1 cutinase family protein [Nocardia sp. alder85J]
MSTPGHPADRRTARATRRLAAEHCGRFLHRRTAAACWSLLLVLLVMATRYPCAVAQPDTGQPGLATGQGCPAVAGVFVAGTWETGQDADPRQPVGMLAPIATALGQKFGAGFTAIFPAYPARAMDGLAYGDSESLGVAAASQALSDLAERCTATKFLISGYSQGADAAGDLAAAIGCRRSPVPPSRILAVGLLADPQQGTAGGKLVGPPVQGTGIRGTRAGGFCALSAVTAELCATDDLYCSTSAASNPVIAALGRVLTQPTGAMSAPSSATQAPDSPVSTSAPDSAGVTRSLTSGVAETDLARLPAELTAVIGASRSGGADPAALTAAATNARDTLGRLTDLSTWISANPDARQQLSTATQGTSDQSAGQVLDTVGSGASNLSAATTALTTLITALSGTTTTAGAGPDIASAADTLASSTAALTTPADLLAHAAPALSLLKPSTLIGQVTNVAANTLAFGGHLPEILDTLGRIPAAVTAGDTDLAGKVRTVHDLFGTVNHLCEPLVQMAAGVDLHTVAAILAAIPDPSGVAGIASLVVSMLGNLDVVGLARQVGQLQEDLWHIVETLTSGADLATIATAFVQLIPTVLGFATTALDTITGTKSSHADDVTVTGSGGVTDLAGLASQLTQAASSHGADDVSQLVGDGITAASFVGSGAHQSYDRYAVDSSGRTAVQWLTDWFGNRIQQAGIGA